MSFSAITTAAGAGFPSGGVLLPPPTPLFNHTLPDPRQRANTTSFVTISSTFTTTSSSISSTTFSTTATTTVSVTPIPATSSDIPLLESNAALTRTNIIITLVLGGVAILLLVIIAILLGLYIRRRRRKREDNSPPFTSLAAQSPTFPRNTQQSGAPQIPLEDFRGTSLSMGPQRNTYGLQAFTSHPPNRPGRSFSAPTAVPQITIPPPTPGFEGLPAINVQPNTPSVLARDDSGQVSPISQPRPARMAVFREELQEGPSIAPASTGVVGRVGIPAVAGGQRESVGTMVSDMGFEHVPEAPEERGNARGVLHSTRASSGVFPEP